LKVISGISGDKELNKPARIAAGNLRRFLRDHYQKVSAAKSPILGGFKKNNEQVRHCSTLVLLVWQ